MDRSSRCYRCTHQGPPGCHGDRTGSDDVTVVSKGKAPEAATDNRVAIVQHQTERITARLFFAYFDLWVGLFYSKKDRAVYICPIPMFGIKISWKRGRAR